MYRYTTVLVVLCTGCKTQAARLNHITETHNLFIKVFKIWSLITCIVHNNEHVFFSNSTSFLTAMHIKLHAGNSCRYSNDKYFTIYTPWQQTLKFCTYFFVISLTPSTCTYMYRSKILPKQIDRFYSRSDIDNTSCSRGSRFYSTGCLRASSMHDGVTWAALIHVMYETGVIKYTHDQFNKCV